MAKMLFEMWLPQAIAKAKEDVSKGDLWKYARYYRMYMERYAYKEKESGRDLTRAIENTLFFRGQCMLVKSAIYGVVVCEVDDKSILLDPNGEPEYVSGTALDGKTKFTKQKIGKDCVIMYADSTRIAPLLYIWAYANNILELQDIIKQQNNMLRKPIIIKGEGAGFDNAINKVMNVLSGIEFMNLNDRKGKGSAMDTPEPIEVLNLQVGNSYKGIELWDNVKHNEEFICDYLGYTTTKNEKRERMNSLEITNENSIGTTLYKAQDNERNRALEECKKIGINIVKTNLLEIEEGGKNNDSENEMDRPNSENK